jgi:Ser/Thr protein kinase RdoA (MazF antagonist)
MIRGFVETIEQRGLGRIGPLGEMVEAGQRALREFDRRVAPYADQLPRGVVHHDAHCQNVLFRDGRLVALIDFDDAYEGYLVADVVRLMESWATDWRRLDPPDLTKAVRVVREYERHRPLTQAERELFPLGLFLLSDTASFVQGEIERGRDATVALSECRQYQRYQALKQDSGWLASFRRALWGT